MHVLDMFGGGGRGVAERLAMAICMLKVCFYLLMYDGEIDLSSCHLGDQGYTMVTNESPLGSL